MRGTTPENLDGRTFGLLTVESVSERRSGAGKRIFWCRCACGVRKEIIGADLKSGRTTSCGCLRDAKSAARSIERREDFTGQRLGPNDIEVIGPSILTSKSKRGNGRVRNKALWDCRCKCGATFEATISSLKLGQVSGCGCVHRERSATAAVARATRVELFGETMTLADVAAIGSVELPTLRHRVNNQGRSVEDAAFAPPARKGRRGEPRTKVPF